MIYGFFGGSVQRVLPSAIRCKHIKQLCLTRMAGRVVATR